VLRLGPRRGLLCPFPRLGLLLASSPGWLLLAIATTVGLLLAVAAMALLLASRLGVALLSAAVALLLLLRPALRLPLFPAGCSGRGFAARSGLEAFDDPLLDLAIDQPLDRRHQRPVLGTDQRDASPSTAGAAGAADSMYVILGHVGHVVVDHVRQRLDVEAARRDVGGYQHAQLVVLEARQRAHARVLALVAVDRIGLDTAFLELLREAVGAVLGLGEDQHLPPVVCLHEVREELALAVGGDRVLHLADELGRRVAACDLDRDRVLHEGPGELADLLRESRREEQVLPVAREAGRGSCGYRG
jgi:hypothetical protein